MRANPGADGGVHGTFPITYQAGVGRRFKPPWTALRAGSVGCALFFVHLPVVETQAYASLRFGRQPMAAVSTRVLVIPNKKSPLLAKTARSGIPSFGDPKK